MALMMIDQKY